MATAPQPTVTRHDLETALIQKCWKDADFKKQVVSDPKGMLEHHMGRKLPAQLQIVIHEEDVNTLHFSIPANPSDVTELSDDDLATVAGGTDLLVTGASVLTVLLGGGVLAGMGTLIAEANGAKPW